MIKKITIFFLGLMLFIPMSSFAASNSKITIDMHYIVVSPTEDGSTNMMNMVNYTNLSTSEYIGEGKSEAVLNVTLPSKATGLNFLDGKIAMKQVDSGFITTDPIPANQTVVLPYSYRVPKDEIISLKLDYPVQMMQVLVPEGMGSIEFTGVEATNQGLFKFEEQNYVGYSVEGIDAGKSITMVYNKDKQPEANPSTNTEANSEGEKTGAVTKAAPDFHNPGHLRMWSQSPVHNLNPHVFSIVLLAILIAGVSYYAYFRRKAKLEEEKLGADKEEKAFKLLMAKQKAIMDKILELEEMHENGEVSVGDYQKKLDAYKDHLVQVKLNLRKFID